MPTKVTEAQRKKIEAERKTMAVDIDDFKAQVDAVDTLYGGNDVVAALIGTLDKMIATMESHGRVYRRRKHQHAGASGFRNVYFHKQSKKYTGRIRRTGADGKMKVWRIGYFVHAENASRAIEELRSELGMD